MIDFRYHLVSIISVFLALAIGIVIGTTALNGGLLSNLSTQVQGLKTDKANLRNDVDTARTAEQQQRQFLDQVAPALVANRLSGRSVILVSLPGASSGDRDAVTTLLTAAGATISAQVRVQDRFVDPASDVELATLVRSGPGSASGSSQRRAAEVLARSLQVPGTAAGPDGTSSVLADFTRAGMIAVDGTPRTGALTVLLVGSATEDQAPALATATTDLALAFDGGGGAVVAGPKSSADDAFGVLHTLRGDSQLTQVVSTVDSVDLSAGRVGCIYALQEQGRGGVGQYGLGGRAQAVLPSPTPS